MPKIRGIKPETWTDENFVELTPLARLLFIGLWTYACDNGHVEDKSKQIKMRLLPADDCNAAELLRELAASGRIVREDGWITIPRFADHQRIDKRWFVACEKPGCAKPGEESANPEREPRRGHHEATTRPPSDHSEPTSGPREQVASVRADVDVDCEVDGDGELMVSSTAIAVARADHEPTAQSFVAEWIEHCEQRPPGRVIGHVAKEIKTMLDEGIDPARVRHGLAEWNRRGLHPSTLASVVHETSERRTRPGRNQETEDIFSRAAVRMGVIQGGQQ